MFDVIIFGAGWKGEKREIGISEGEVILPSRFTNEPVEKFKVIQYKIKDSVYLVAYYDAIPVADLVEKAILEFAPRPFR